VINGHVRGRYLDDKAFRPILECVNKLNAPIYIHPTAPPQPVIDAYYKGFSPAIDNMLMHAGWGWHIETAVHIIRMIVGGVFDEYPDLQIIIGHMGEALPFMLQRMDKTLSAKLTGLRHSAAYYLRNNVHYTFSGFNYTSNFLTLLMEVGVDRIMFSADYPYSSMKEARMFLDKLPVSDVDRERIASGNAKRLLKLDTL
ncbi:MAG TPA: amidohydrolase family protein, partial [Candidatus Babeliaceae bacterium]|nr:amidohydrolase family protein [Candidatus Babeliaceae bacterium]